MGEKGWSVTYISDDEVGGDLPEEQRARYRRDDEACTAAYKKVYPDIKLTRAVLEDLYAQELAAKACLERLGIPVDPPMSKQSYVDAYLSGGFPSWSSYLHVTEAKMGFDEVERRCPQPKAR